MFKKSILIVVCVLLILSSSVMATDDVKNAGLTPDDLLWRFDVAFDDFMLSFIKDETKRADKIIEIAQERLLEMGDMIEKDKFEASQKALEEHAEILIKLEKDEIVIVKDNAQQQYKYQVDVEAKLELHQERVVIFEDEIKETKKTFTKQQHKKITDLLYSLDRSVKKTTNKVRTKRERIKTQLKYTHTADEIIKLEKDKYISLSKLAQSQANRQIVLAQRKIDVFENTKLPVSNTISKHKKTTVPNYEGVRREMKDKSEDIQPLDANSPLLLSNCVVDIRTRYGGSVKGAQEQCADLDRAKDRNGQNVITGNVVGEIDGLTSSTYYMEENDIVFVDGHKIVIAKVGALLALITVDGQTLALGNNDVVMFDNSDDMVIELDSFFYIEGATDNSVTIVVNSQSPLVTHDVILSPYSDYYLMFEGDVVEFEEHSISLIAVGDGAILVTVDGQTLSVGEESYNDFSVANNLRVIVKEIYFIEDSDDNSAVIDLSYGYFDVSEIVASLDDNQFLMHESNIFHVGSYDILLKRVGDGSALLSVNGQSLAIDDDSFEQFDRADDLKIMVIQSHYVEDRDDNFVVIEIPDFENLIDENPVECIDTDGGENIYVKGSATGFEYLNIDTVHTQEDTCVLVTNYSNGHLKSHIPRDNCYGENCYLYEMQCAYRYDDLTSLGRVLSTGSYIVCENGCSNGVCIGEDVVLSTECIESEHDDVYVQGTTYKYVYNANGEKISGETRIGNDRCYSISDPTSKYLSEFHCSGDSPNHEIKQHKFYCENGCSNGACIKKTTLPSATTPAPILTVNINPNPIIDFNFQTSVVTVESDQKVVCTYVDKFGETHYFPNQDINDLKTFKDSLSLRVDYSGLPANYSQNIICRNIDGLISSVHETVELNPVNFCSKHINAPLNIDGMELYACSMNRKINGNSIHIYYVDSTSVIIKTQNDLEEKESPLLHLSDTYYVNSVVDESIYVFLISDFVIGQSSATTKSNITFINMGIVDAQSCFNNIQDPFEEGIDCGGVCEKECVEGDACYRTPSGEISEFVTGITTNGYFVAPDRCDQTFPHKANKFQCNPPTILTFDCEFGCKNGSCLKEPVPGFVLYPTIADTCASNIDCDANYFCGTNNLCHVKCHTNVECAPTQFCAVDTCVEFSFLDTHDCYDTSHCDDGYSCTENYDCVLAEDLEITVVKPEFGIGNGIPAYGVGNLDDVNFEVYTSQDAYCRHGFSKAVQLSVENEFESLEPFVRSGSRNHFSHMAFSELGFNSLISEETKPWVIICEYDGVYAVKRFTFGFDSTAPQLEVVVSPNPITDPQEANTLLTVVSDDLVVCNYVDENGQMNYFENNDIANESSYAAFHSQKLSFWGAENGNHDYVITCRNLAGFSSNFPLQVIVATFENEPVNCFNSLQDSNEEGVDCGGACSRVCAEDDDEEERSVIQCAGGKFIHFEKGIDLAKEYLFDARKMYTKSFNSYKLKKYKNSYDFANCAKKLAIASISALNNGKNHPNDDTSDTVEDGFSPYVGGYNGIEIQFIDGQPPHEEYSIFDNAQSTFNVGIELTNEGEHHIEEGDFLEVELRGIIPEQFNLVSADLIKYLDSPLMGMRKNLDGSIIGGQSEQIIFEGLSYLPDARGDLPKSFQVNICYAYTTYSVTPICLADDVTAAFSANGVCQVSGVKQVESSSGPVQISDFKQLPQGGNKVAVIFTVSHVGDGRIYRLGSSLKCDANLRNTDRNKVDVSVSLRGNPSAEINCQGFDKSETEGVVTLWEGNPRTITCDIKSNAGISESYEDLLSVELGYMYEQSDLTFILVKDASAMG